MSLKVIHINVIHTIKDLDVYRRYLFRLLCDDKCTCMIKLFNKCEYNKLRRIKWRKIDVNIKKIK